MATSVKMSVPSSREQSKHGFANSERRLSASRKCQKVQPEIEPWMSSSREKRVFHKSAAKTNTINEGHDNMAVYAAAGWFRMRSGWRRWGKLERRLGPAPNGKGCRDPLVVSSHFGRWVCRGGGSASKG
jgi:hypothetical protein